MQKMSITDKDYQFLYKMVYDASGINLHDGKKELLKAKIAKRLRATKISSAEEYLKVLKNNENEFIEFIDTVTTNHTYFFRENTGCEYLVKLLVNQYKNRPIKIWCAASSTGEEPYSIVIQFLEMGYDVKLLATDISHTVLAKAEQGVFNQNRANNMPVNMLHKYFQKGSKNKELIKVKDPVKRCVTFRKFNLLTDTPPNETFDIIFCRNVLIYFDDPTSELVVNKLSTRLDPKGHFLVGHSESLMNLKHPLVGVRKVSGTYIKP
jgi:chemotaxis protein methyltransferase CheR